MVQRYAMWPAGGPVARRAAMLVKLVKLDVAIEAKRHPFSRR